jgi:hypothetical protein
MKWKTLIGGALLNINVDTFSQAIKGSMERLEGLKCVTNSII